jgi:hypothetical protein
MQVQIKGQRNGFIPPGLFFHRVISRLVLFSLTLISLAAGGGIGGDSKGSGQHFCRFPFFPER